jgi:hypothetical protein
MVISDKYVLILMEAIVAYMKLLSQHWPGDTEEYHKTPAMIDDNKAEIQTGYLSNISLERYSSKACLATVW